MLQAWEGDGSQIWVDKTIQRVPSGVLLMQPAMAKGKCWWRTSKIGAAPLTLTQEHRAYDNVADNTR